MSGISRERAERIAKGHACARCKEYSYRRLTAKPAPKSITDELGAIWIVARTCGICDHEGELGLEADGDIVFES